MTLFLSKRPELAIDFGTANLRLISPDAGVIFDEPSLCCFADYRTNPRLVAAGTDAVSMIDRTPQSLQVRRPLRRGVLQDIPTAADLLRYAVPKALGRKSVRALRTLIGVPSDATQAECRALLTAANDAGLNVVRLLPEPLLAAVGAGAQIEAPAGVLLVECGAGTTEVAVMSLGAICLTRSVRVGGAALNQAIADHLHLHHKLLIGDPTAERIKRDYSARPRGSAIQGDIIQVRGRSLISMAPASLDVAVAELDRVIERHIRQIIHTIREVLNLTPPELSHDQHSNGVLLTGGSAIMPHLDTMIEKEIGLPAVIAESPALCVARGLHRALRAPGIGYAA